MSILSFIGWAILVIVCIIIGIMVLGKILGLIWAIISDVAGLVFALIVFIGIIIVASVL
jgi:hypothetical protein